MEDRPSIVEISSDDGSSFADGRKDDPGPLVVLISSDDELSSGDGRKVGGCGFERGEFTEENCYSLLSRLVVSEVCAKPCRNSVFKSLKQYRKVGDLSNDGGDDDCVILDDDPDKPPVVVNANDLGDDSDDLRIVFEKGEVARRDFPHARHLCVNYVFASTLHKDHCSLCYCYVCDSPAPCSQWGDGFHTDDHCNANDNEERWKVERERIKKDGKPMPVNPLPIIPATGDTIDGLLRVQEPDNGFVTINVDASIINNVARCGIVIRNSEGKLCHGLQARVELQIISELSAVLWAIMIGMEEAWNKNYRRVVLESDNLEAVNLCHGRSGNTMLDRFVRKIERMMKMDWTVEVKHIPRTKNRMADAFAKLDWNVNEASHAVMRLVQDEAKDKYNNSNNNNDRGAII